MLLMAAVLSIAVAVGANTAIFSLANELMFAMPSARRPDQLVHIRMGGGSHVSHRQWRPLEESGALARPDRLQHRSNVNWQGPDQTLSLIPMVVAANFFDVIGVPFAMGRGFTARRSAGRTRSRGRRGQLWFWQRRLSGDPKVVGSTLIVQWPAIHRVSAFCRRVPVRLPGSASRLRSICRSAAC